MLLVEDMLTLGHFSRLNATFFSFPFREKAAIKSFKIIENGTFKEDEISKILCADDELS